MVLLFSLNEGDLKFLVCGECGNDDGGDDEIDAAQQLFKAIENKDATSVERVCVSNVACVKHKYGLTKSTALHFAAAKSETILVKTLLKFKVDVRVVDTNGATALHVAAGQGNTEVIQLLIDAGADVNAQDYARDKQEGKETPLHRAAIGGHVEAIRSLISAGAKV